MNKELEEINEGELNKDSFVATFRVPKTWLPLIKNVTVKYHNSRSEFYRHAIFTYILMINQLRLD